MPRICYEKDTGWQVVTIFKQKAARTVIMRISPVLLLLPILVLTGSTAIATDDRPISPQPAIASPVATPLTIESLAGTYKMPVERQVEAALAMTKSQTLEAIKQTFAEQGRVFDEAAQRYYEEAQKHFEITFRKSYDKYKDYRLIINKDSTFDLLTGKLPPGKLHGQVRLDGNKLIFTNNLSNLTANPGSTTTPSPSITILTVSADGKELLYYDPKHRLSPGVPPVVFVKE